ncbi:MAG: type II toxin-antitoxin system Phd/YefM family antitoxin [Candidatus Competibacteraceae bacterium]
MLKLNIHEAKTHLSRYLPALEQGETLILCKRNIPIAEIRPLPKPRTLPRPIDLAADRGVELPPEFFEPLSAELLH